MELALAREVMSAVGCSYYTALNYLSDNNWNLPRTVARIRSDIYGESREAFGGYEASSSL